MALRVVVVGIPGVGKTTIVEKLVAGYKGSKLANFGSVMLEAAISLGMAEQRDQMRKLPVEKQRELQKVAAARIAGMTDKVVVVDTHLFIRTQEGFWPGLPYEVVRELKPTHLVLVEATPEEIQKRRLNDATRYRDEVSQESLTDELSLARGFLTTSSTLTGAPMLILRNAEGKADEVAQSLVKMLGSAVG